MFTQAQKYNIETSLNHNGIVFSVIEYGLNDDVTVKMNATADQILAAKAGLFASLKPIAWRISDAIGNGQNVEILMSVRYIIVDTSEKLCYKRGIFKSNRLTNWQAN